MVDHVNTAPRGPHRDHRGPGRGAARRQALDRRPARGRHRHADARCRASSTRCARIPTSSCSASSREADAAWAVLQAAEIGHLVFAAMSTVSAVDTIDRFVELFPPHRQRQARAIARGDVARHRVAAAAAACRRAGTRARGRGPGRERTRARSDRRPGAAGRARARDDARRPLRDADLRPEPRAAVPQRARGQRRRARARECGRARCASRSTAPTSSARREPLPSSVASPGAPAAQLPRPDAAVSLVVVVAHGFERAREQRRAGVERRARSRRPVGRGATSGEIGVGDGHDLGDDRRGGRGRADRRGHGGLRCGLGAVERADAGRGRCGGGNAPVSRRGLRLAGVVAPGAPSQSRDSAPRRSSRVQPRGGDSRSAWVRHSTPAPRPARVQRIEPDEGLPGVEGEHGHRGLVAAEPRAGDRAVHSGEGSGGMRSGPGMPGHCFAR